MTSSNAVPVLRVRVFSVADQDQWDLLRSDITTTCTVFTDIITTDRTCLLHKAAEFTSTSIRKKYFDGVQKMYAVFLFYKLHKIVFYLKTIKIIV